MKSATIDSSESHLRRTLTLLDMQPPIDWSVKVQTPMQCLRCLCVQCRDPMKLVNAENGVSVPDKNGKPVMLHSECFRTWLNMQAKSELTPNFQNQLTESAPSLVTSTF